MVFRLLIALDCMEGNLLRVGSHETWHYIKNTAARSQDAGFKQEAEALEQFVLDKLQETKGYDLATRIKEKIDQYQKLGENLTEADAREEIAADSLFAVFSDEGNVSEFVAENKTLAQKIRGFVKGFLDDVKRMLKNIGKHNPEASAMLQQNADTLQTIYDRFTSLLGETKDAQQNMETMEDGGVKLSQADEAADALQAEEGKNEYFQQELRKDLEQRIDDYISGKSRSGDFLLGRTPKKLREIGFSDLPIFLSASHMGLYLYDYLPQEEQNRIIKRMSKRSSGDLEKTQADIREHAIGKDGILGILKKIEDPIGIIAMRPTREGKASVMVLFDATMNGKRQVGALTVNAKGSIDNVTYNANLIASTYGKGNVDEMVENAAAMNINGSNGINYWNTKKAPLPILQGSNIRAFTASGSFSNSSIIGKGLDVNGGIVDWDKKTQTDTNQFKRWFGESVIKEGENPKVMYHGTMAQFTQFDKKKARSSGAYGSGFYFTDQATHAGQYGNKLAVYLRVEHPLQHGDHNISKGQVKNFLEAVAEDEDYGLDNYGYGATVDSVLKSVFNGRDDFDILQDINATAVGDMAAAIQLFNKVNKTNYDGIIAPTETVVFNANQIKSATDNVGTFSLKNDNFLYSLSDGEVTLPAMGIDPAYAFKYGEAEAEAAEKKIEQRKADIRDMIQRNSFMALQITKKDGRKEILSRSVRPGVAWQLTYYGSDGEPTMHENYGRTGTGRVNEAVHTEDELYTHFTNMTLRNDLKVETLDDVPDGDGVRYSVADDNHTIRQQIREHAKELSEMPVLANVSTKSINLQKYYDAGAKSREAARKLWAYEQLGKYGEYIHRDNFGDVKITKNRLKIGMAYIHSDEELAAYLAIPSIIQYGRRINYHEDHKNRPVNSFTFAGPITIDGIPGNNMAVVVHESTEDGEKRYKTHAVLLPNNGLLEFDTEEEEAGTMSRHGTNAVEATPTTSSDDKIAEDGNDVKRNKRSLADGDYLSAVESGDTDAAKRLVDEAARAAGYTYHAYHGTDADFTEFDKRTQGRNYGGYSQGLFFFTNKKNTADNYASQDGHTMDVWLKIDDPLVIQSPGLVNPIEFYDDHAGEFLQEMRRTDKDGIIVKGTGEYEGRILYGIVEPTQIKSADPVTYDDDGNVIPLSERFNPEKKDIRYSLADVEPADTGMDALVAENEGLKKTVEALQQELAAWHKGTAGHTFSKTAMRDLARRRLKTGQSLQLLTRIKTSLSDTAKQIMCPSLSTI